MGAFKTSSLTKIPSISCEFWLDMVNPAISGGVVEAVDYESLCMVGLEGTCHDHLV